MHDSICICASNNNLKEIIMIYVYIIYIKNMESLCL